MAIKKPAPKTAAKKPAKPAPKKKRDDRRFKTSGLVYTVLDAEDVTDTFTKRVIVLDLTDNPQYPQLVAFEFVNDRCADLDDVAAGDSVTITFSLRGREWTAGDGTVKYFNTLSAFKIESTNEDDIPF